MSRDALTGRQDAGAPGDGGAGVEIPASAAYRVSLPEFEGPLDLLLHLCKTHEIEIINIPISFITSKYLEYLELMQSMSVEVAAEYLVMAATLAYLKSRELVPTPEPLETASEDGEGEDALDPREELIRRLLEYQKYKDAAEKLGGRPIEGKTVFGRGIPMEATGDAGLAEHSVWKLIESWGKLLDKSGPKHTHNVVVDRMSITDRINQLVDLLETGGGTFRFDTIIDTALPEPELRHQVVVTLLAVLELAKLRVIRVLQDSASGAFYVSTREGAALEEARRAKVTSDESAAAAAEEAAEQAAAVAEPAKDAEAELAALAAETTPEAAPEEGAVELAPEAGDAFAEADAALAEVEAAVAEADAAIAETAPDRARVRDTSTPEEPDGTT